MRMPTMTAIALIVLMLSSLSSVLASPVLVEDFDDDILNSNLWEATVTGYGPTSSESNHRLEITLPATSNDDPNEGAFGAGIRSKWRLAGDYDIQIDYECLVWPYSSGVRTGYGAADSALRLSRGMEGADEDPREIYITTGGAVPTADLSGKLRQTRVAGLVTSYYYDSGIWKPIGAPIISNGDVLVGISAWSHDVIFRDQQVTVAFDNFIINSGQTVPAIPEPASLLALASGLGMVGMVRRRRR